MEGWIKLHWKIRKSLAWSNGTAAALWVEILLSTARKRNMLQSGEVLEPGQCLLSQEKLAQWLGVNRRTVNRMIAGFERDGMVKVEKVGRNGTLLSVCNWGTYQRSKSLEWASSAQEAHSKRTASAQEARKKRTQTEIPKSPKSPERESSAASPQRPRPSDGLKEVRAYWAHANLKGDPAAFFEWNQTRGWRGVEDWTAAARLWSTREKQFGDKAMAGRHDADLTIPQEAR